MAKSVRAVDNGDGTGVVETVDGDDVITIHYAPDSGYPKSDLRVGPLKSTADAPRTGKPESES